LTYNFQLLIFFKLQSLRVSNYLTGRDQPEFAVKVLTCDSISQAKRKIVDVAFMNICQSHRPTLESVDIGELSFWFLLCSGPRVILLLVWKLVTILITVAEILIGRGPNWKKVVTLFWWRFSVKLQKWRHDFFEVRFRHNQLEKPQFGQITEL